MSVLASCQQCEGFVPSSSEECPHCGHRDAGRARRTAKSAGKLAAAAVTMVTLMACYGGGPRYMVEPPMPACTPQDKDMDGAYTCQNPSELPAGGMNVDCDDANGNVFPGAVDPMGDGIDQDCDGADGTPSTRAPIGEPTPAGALQPQPAPAPAPGFATPPPT